MAYPLGYQEHEDGSADYMEAEFLNGRPSDEVVKALIMDWYNQKVDETILKGFSYEGVQVWLSRENQFNYKAAYDLAVQTNGATLPVVFKFGTDERPFIGSSRHWTNWQTSIPKPCYISKKRLLTVGKRKIRSV